MCLPPRLWFGLRPWQPAPQKPLRSAASIRSRARASQSAKDAVELAAEIVNSPHPELGGLPLAATAGLPHLGGAKIELIVAPRSN